MEIFRLLGTVAIDTEQAIQSLNNVSQQAEDTGLSASDAFGEIGKVAGTIGKAVITAGAAIGGAWLVAIESTREYRTEMGKLDTAFQTNGHSSESAKKAYSDLHAVLGDSAQAVEAANHLAVLTDNEKDLQTWTDICTGIYTTFGDSLPIEGLTEAANETAKVGQVTGPLADALNWAGISEDDFNEKLKKCSTEQERQKLIMDTLNGTYKDASDQYKKTNKDVMDANRANEALADAYAEIGRIGEPILTAIKIKVAEMVQVAVPLLESFVQKVKDLKHWIEGNRETINTWIAVILGASVAIGTFLLILNWGKIMAAANAVKVVRTAILAMNAAILANPIGVIIALIAGLVAAFIYLWNTNEGFRKFWIDMWNKIKSAGGTAIDWIKSKFNVLNAALSTVRTVFGNIYSTISQKINSAKEAVGKAIEKIKGFFNFKWSLPNLKLPSISIKGKFSINPPSVPKFSIKWNAEGGILKKPTIFGMTGNTFLGDGEAGAEAIAPIAVLQDYVTAAVKAENEGIRKTLIEQNGILIDFLARTMPNAIQLDSGVLVGALTPAIDMQLSDRWNHSKRGNTR